MGITTCRTCHEPFTPVRAGARYCSGKCRTTAYRRRQVGPSLVRWRGDQPRFSTASRGANSLSNSELAKRLIEVSETADDGEPKTGRRFYYLALSRGYIRPDMSDSDTGKRSRNAAYKRVTDVLGGLRRHAGTPH